MGPGQQMTTIGEAPKTDIQTIKRTQFKENDQLSLCQDNKTRKYTTFEPQHEISINVVCATNKSSDQPAHMRSLIRAFSSRLI